jgi:outer membrane protein TolC
MPRSDLTKLYWWSALVSGGLLVGCAHYKAQPIVPRDTAASLRARSLSDEGLREFFETNRPGSAQDWPRRSWDLDGLVMAAFYYHPSLEVARADWGLAQAGIRTASARPNPNLSVVPTFSKGVANNFSPWAVTASVDVPVETAGKRGRRIEQAEHLSESARLNIATTAWQIRSKVRSALLDYVASAARAGLLAEQASLQEQIVQRLTQQLNAGAVGAGEIMAGRAALAKTRADMADTKRQLAGAQVRLADSIGVPAATLDGVSVAFDLTKIPAAEAVAPAEVREAALHSRTDILGALAEYAATESALRLEIAKQYPDVHLSPGYGWNQQNEGDSQWQLGLTVDLPVLNQNQGPIAEAEARRKATAARFIALQASVISEIDGALAIYGASGSNLAALQTLVAAKRAQRDVTAAQRQAGAADRLELASAELDFKTAALAEFDARVQMQQAVGALEDAVQRPLELPKAVYGTREAKTDERTNPKAQQR